MWKFHISLLFHWFECTNFKNSNLFEYVSKFYDRNFLKSKCDGLSNDILIIFFEHMVRNIFLVEDGMLIIIQSNMIPFLTLCANQIDFSRFRGLFSNPFILITTYQIETIEGALERWDVRLSNTYKNICWKSTDHSGNTFRISTDPSGNTLYLFSCRDEFVDGV